MKKLWQRNPTARASKCRDLSRQVTAEAARWQHGRVHRQLMAASLQLAYLARAAHGLDSQVVESYITTAEELLAKTMTDRAFGGTR